jgi:hypothetical protein
MPQTVLLGWLSSTGRRHGFGLVRTDEVWCLVNAAALLAAGALDRVVLFVEESPDVRWEWRPDEADDAVPRAAEETGLVLPGWSCPECFGFNGAGKEWLAECRACGTPRAGGA